MGMGVFVGFYVGGYGCVHARVRNGSRRVCSLECVRGVSVLWVCAFGAGVFVCVCVRDVGVFLGVCVIVGVCKWVCVRDLGVYVDGLYRRAGWGHTYGSVCSV